MKSHAIVTLTDPCRKSCDKNDDFKLVTVLEEGVNVPYGVIALPLIPVFFLVLGSLRSDPSLNCSPSRQIINHCVNFEGRVSSVQECSEKLHLQSYLEMLWSETVYIGLLGIIYILFIILLYLIER